MYKLPETGFLRLSQILPQPAVTDAEANANRAALAAAIKKGDPLEIRKARARPRKASEGTPGIIPVSKSSWWSGIRDLRYPQPVKLGPRTTAWKVEDIRQLVDDASDKQSSGKRGE